ncbi:MAG: hypothetical protein AAF943_08370 [Pseudomonadota bacterium]
MYSTSLKPLVGGLVLACLTACSAPQSTVTRSASDTGARSFQASAVSQEFPMQVFLTGYSFWDNTPPGSSAIALPRLRSRAGGTGTYRDPITLAVGHVKNGTRSTPDFRPGTRFYIQKLRRYAIVEDVCGDGPKPQNGPCHIGYKGRPWIDIWVGGRRVDKGFVQRCMYRLTGLQQVIRNPGPDYPVDPGEISASGCRVY